MTESAPTAKNYRAYAVRLRQEANDMIGPDNQAFLRSFADNYDSMATSIESATALEMQRAFGDHLPESRGQGSSS